MKIKNIILGSCVLLLNILILNPSTTFAESMDEQSIKIDNTIPLVEQYEATQETKNNLNYEESQSLPFADLSKDLNTSSNRITLYSTSNPSSVTDYKNLGYKNVNYTKWTGDKKVASTKSKRIATYVVTNVLGFVPSTYVRAAIGIYDLTSTLQTQNPDVWPTVNTRNILATSPRGIEVIIGQETIVKYYGNSARTKLIKTVNKTFWIG